MACGLVNIRPHYCTGIHARMSSMRQLRPPTEEVALTGKEKPSQLGGCSTRDSILRAGRAATIITKVLPCHGGDCMPVRVHPSVATRPMPITTAAAAPLGELPQVTKDLFQYMSWQDEAWDYWRNLGELNQGEHWLSASLARVRLMAAEQVPGKREPEILEKGIAVDLMNSFGGGVSKQSALMSSFGTQLTVPGECWLVVERDGQQIPLEMADWRVVPTTALRPKQGPNPVKLRLGENIWRPLADEGLATKVWRQDPQFPWRAWSPVQAALPILRRIDLVDRRIVAYMVSRLASNGILIIPQEGNIESGVPSQYQDAANPFYQQLIDLGSNSIARPGTASAALPLIIKFAAEYIDKWKLLTWSDVLSPELMDERDKEIKRLAVTLSMPAEWLTGMGDVKYWNAFHLTEEAVNLYVMPDAELIADAVTKGFLYPALKSMGEKLTGPNGGAIIVWPDASELVAPQDKTAQATAAYDRFELDGPGFRRELGLDETDKPEDEELKDMALKRMLQQPQTAVQALKELTGIEVAPVTVPSGGTGQLSGFGMEEQTPPENTALAVRRPSPRPRHAASLR